MSRIDDLSIVAVKSALEDFQPISLSNDKRKPLPPVTPPKTSRQSLKEKDLNDVLIQVRTDIQQIKNLVLKKLGNGQTVEPEKIKQLFEQAEKGIEDKKRDIVTQFHAKATVLNVHTERTNRRRDNAEKQNGVLQLKSNVQNATPHPSDEKALALQKLKNVINPACVDARSLLKKHYGIPLPRESKMFNTAENSKTEAPKSSRFVGNSVSYYAPAPKSNRVSSRVTPPPPTDGDKRKGIMNLIERKIIPASSHLTISPSPVKQQPAVLRGPLDIRHHKRELASAKPHYNMALVKFDETSLKDAVDFTNKRRMTARNETISGDSFFASQLQLATQPRESDVTTQPLTDSDGKFTGSMNTNPMLSLKSATGMPPNSSELKHRSTHKIAIQHGTLLTTTEDFLMFKQFYILSWSAIMSLLRVIEKLMLDYSIPLAFIDGHRLADMSLFFEVGPRPTIKELLMCIVNNEEVERYIKTPGRRYMAPDGVESAIIKIQSTWRRYDKHSTYLEYRRQKWAASIIALRWIMKCKLTMIRMDIRKKNVVCLRHFRARAKMFQQNWKRIKNSKRLIIHIPSYGYSVDVRRQLHDIGVLQNTHIGRICDLKDPNVEVIYISPVKMTDDILHYYHKLIDVMSASCGIDADDAKSRLKILTPENWDRFPQHNFCLSTLLKYSVCMVERLKNLIKGKTAYIVPGMMHTDDLFLSEQFDVPIIGSEPEIAQSYSMKSGMFRIFESAGVSTAPCVYDVYSMSQIYESLAKLITDNLNITRWLFKIDNQFNGRGTACCDLTSFMLHYERALREQERYDEKWDANWVQESRFNLIMEELPNILANHCTPVDKKLFPKWENFIREFCHQGGTIEGCPPSGSVTGLTANVLIEPDGVVNILTVADQIHSTSPYKCWGHTLPQTSIDPDTVNKSVLLITQACKARGIIGYVSMDFVTFIDPKSDAQQLWAVGLNIAYNNSYAMTQLMQFLTNSCYDSTANSLTVKINKQTRTNIAYSRRLKATRPSQEEVIECVPRFCVYSPNLFHTNLNNVHRGVFFKICKAHGIGYDEQLKMGTVFTLLDHVRRESMGMIFIGETLYDTVWNFKCNLQIIHHDISSPTMPGRSDFNGAIEDLSGILKLLEVNSTIDQDLYPTLDPLRRIRSAGSNRIFAAPPEEKCQQRKAIESTPSNSVAKDDRLGEMNSSDGIVCIDNRFPSSPVSDIPGDTAIPE